MNTFFCLKIRDLVICWRNWNFFDDLAFEGDEIAI